MRILWDSIKMLFARKSYRRQHERFNCNVQAALHFLEDGLTLQGHVLEISQGGLKFKPNQTFLMRRFGGMVRIDAGSWSVDATIKNSTTSGYGVGFVQKQDATVVIEVLSPSLERVSN